MPWKPEFLSGDDDDDESVKEARSPKRQLKETFAHCNLDAKEERAKREVQPEAISDPACGGIEGRARERKTQKKRKQRVKSTRLLP